MRSWLLRLAGFLAPLLVLGAAVEWAVRQRPTAYSEKARLLATPRASGEVEVLVFGSSHEAVGVDTDALPRAVNCANLSQSLAMDRRVFDRFGKNFPGARRALLGVSYFSLQYSLAHSPFRGRLYHYWHYYGIRGEAGDLDVLDARGLSVAAARGPTLTLRLLLGDEPVAVSPTGWMPQPTPALEYSSAGAVERVAEHLELMDPRWQAANERELLAFVAELTDAGVEPVLLVSPVSAGYRSALPPGGLAAFGRQLSELARPGNLRVADYMADDRFVDADFVDGDHLTPDGARKFAQILDAEVLGRAAAGAGASR